LPHALFVFLGKFHIRMKVATTFLIKGSIVTFGFAIANKCPRGLK
jgi:hypothetical protein